MKLFRGDQRHQARRWVCNKGLEQTNMRATRVGRHITARYRAAVVTTVTISASNPFLPPRHHGYDPRMDIHRKKRLAIIVCSTIGAALAALVGPFVIIDSAEQALPVFAIAFAAVCVWLMVRIVNRRELWATWTLAVIAGLPVLYVASFGPACRLIEEGHISFNSPCWRIYSPLTKIAISPNPSFAKDVVCRWASICGSDVGLMLLVFTLETD